MSPISILVINSLLYITLFIFCCVHKRGVLGKVVICLYGVISIGTLFFYSKGELRSNNMLLWPYLYYFFIFIILLYPLLSWKKVSNSIVVNPKTMNNIGDVYIVLSVIYVILLGNKAVDAITSGDWLAQYLTMRGDDVVYHHNIFEQVVLNLIDYLKIPMILYAFLVYARQISYKRKLLLFISPLVDSMIWALYTASRTDFLIILLLYLTCYLIFKDAFSSTFRKIVRIGFVLIGTLAGIFVLSISISRFGEGETSWLALYFGNSFLVAHNVIGFTTQYSDGTYFAEYLLKLLDLPLKPWVCKIDDGSAFHTLIAMRYADFGPIGLILLSLTLSLILVKIVGKKKVYLGSAALVLYFYRSLLMGGFYDSTTLVSWMVVIALAIILNYYSKTRTAN